MAEKKNRKPVESVSGSYTPIPHAVLDSKAFMEAKHRAKAMLFEFIRQHNGRNNGHMHATSSWLSKRGWLSKEAISKAVTELERRGLILKTKHGGLNAGPSLFALTWIQITDYSGLDIRQKAYWPGAWADNTIPPEQTTRRVKKRETPPGNWGSTDPTAGEASPSTAPAAGATKADFNDSTAPVAGDNECCQFSGSKVWKSPPPSRLRHPLRSPLCIRLVIDNDRGEMRRSA